MKDTPYETPKEKTYKPKKKGGFLQGIVFMALITIGTGSVYSLTIAEEGKSFMEGYMEFSHLLRDYKWYLIISLIVICTIWEFYTQRNQSDEYYFYILNDSKASQRVEAITVLNKRGHDITEYITLLIPFLMSESLMYRTSARDAIKKFYPEDFQLIDVYDIMSKPENRRIMSKPLFKKYKIEQAVGDKI